MSETVTITRLGARGDGIADTPDGPAYVPFTLPGEVVAIAGKGERREIAGIVTPSPDRVSPACRHFGRCGGCALQHMAPSAYRKWKGQRVVDALARAGIDKTPEPLVACEAGSRRRAVFSARNTEAGPVLGFNEAASHAIVEVGECPVLEPMIVGALPRLRELVAILGKTAGPVRLTATASDAGLDVDLAGAGRPADQVLRKIADHALDAGFARVSVDAEIVIEPRKPEIALGGVTDGATVTPPPGGFLQAAAVAEDAMAALVCAHLKKSKRVVDLFAGSGAFALRLALNSMVHAVEHDAAALAALDRGFRFGKRLKTVTTERRDLFRRPLTPAELKRFDGLVFDPPRAGAEAQASAIAKSGVRRVAAVSCNPATFARDLAILRDSGYRLESVTPIDQFLWSPHVEAVALLEKPPVRR
ncbi:MAG: class I SAM-dependent RNA methyltransferase [Rhizobiaceae bacterium]